MLLEILSESPHNHTVRDKWHTCAYFFSVVGLLPSACDTSAPSPDLDSGVQQDPTVGSDSGLSTRPDLLPDSLINQELRLANIIGSPNEDDWNCIAGMFGQPCGSLEREQMRPHPSRSMFISIIDASSGRAEICTGFSSCFQAIFKKQGNQIDFSRTGSTSSDPELTLTRSQGQGWTGQIKLSTQKIFTDVLHSATWTGRVHLDIAKTPPVASLGFKSILDPIYISFDQPIECGSIHPSVVDSNGQTLSFKVYSACDDTNATTSMRGTTRRPRISFLNPSPHVPYLLTMNSVQSRSGLVCETGTQPVFDKASILRTKEQGDFEAPTLSGWAIDTGNPNCKRATELLAKSGDAITPSHGSYMLTCATNSNSLTNRFRGQFMVPEGAEYFSFSLGSGNTNLAPSPTSLNPEISFSIRDNLGNSFSLDSALDWTPPQNKPKGWSGWAEVRMPVMTGARIIEFSISMAPCLNPTAMGCSEAQATDQRENLAVFDNFRFH